MFNLSLQKTCGLTNLIINYLQVELIFICRNLRDISSMWGDLIWVKIIRPRLVNYLLVGLYKTQNKQNPLHNAFAYLVDEIKQATSGHRLVLT